MQQSYLFAFSLLTNYLEFPAFITKSILQISLFQLSDTHLIFKAVSSLLQLQLQRCSRLLPFGCQQIISFPFSIQLFLKRLPLILSLGPRICPLILCAVSGFFKGRNFLFPTQSLFLHARFVSLSDGFGLFPENFLHIIFHSLQISGLFSSQLLNQMRCFVFLLFNSL